MASAQSCPYYTGVVLLSNGFEFLVDKSGIDPDPYASI